VCGARLVGEGANDPKQKNHIELEQGKIIKVLVPLIIKRCVNFVKI
jgi:hypothetical protein